MIKDTKKHYRPPLILVLEEEMEIFLSENSGTNATVSDVGKGEGEDDFGNGTKYINIVSLDNDADW